MTISEYIRECCKKRNMSLSAMARGAGLKPANLNNKMVKNSLYFRDVVNLANALNADIDFKFIDRESGKTLL